MGQAAVGAFLRVLVGVEARKLRHAKRASVLPGRTRPRPLKPGGIRVWGQWGGGAGTGLNQVRSTTLQQENHFRS